MLKLASASIPVFRILWYLIRERGHMDALDVRTKIGLVVVSASSVSELRYPKAAPPGVAFLTSRMMLAPGESIEALVEMESNASRAVGEWPAQR